MKLSSVQQQVLQLVINGWTLKSHRYLDGRKVYQLHSLAGTVEPIRRATVEALRRQGLIDSNKKFPAATYLLTEKGRQVASQLAEIKDQPLTAKNY